MRITSGIYADFFHTLTRPIEISSIAKHILGMGLFILLTALGAFVRVYLPFTPVPITLQTLFVLLAGAYLGSAWGAGAMGLYLLIGICGLPVFAGTTHGLIYLLGPTGGYLMGFVVAAWITGSMIGSKSNPSWLRILFTLTFASLAIYVLGITQLMLWGKCNLIQGLIMGLFPFVPGAIIKILLAATILKGFKRG
jgi:biotin transport system substrate-specific component